MNLTNPKMCLDPREILSTAHAVRGGDSSRERIMLEPSEGHVGAQELFLFTQIPVCPRKNKL